MAYMNGHNLNSEVRSVSLKHTRRTEVLVSRLACNVACGFGTIGTV